MKRKQKILNLTTNIMQSSSTSMQHYCSRAFFETYLEHHSPNVQQQFQTTVCQCKTELPLMTNFLSFMQSTGVCGIYKCLNNASYYEKKIYKHHCWMFDKFYSQLLRMEIS